MTTLLRAAFLLACCTALAAACCVGVRALDVPLAAISAELAEQERYDRATAAAQARLRLKLGLADRLTEGKLPLAEAITAFCRHLDHEAPAEASEACEYGWANVGRMRGETDEERCGRNLITQVEVKLRASPSVAPEVLARLEKELQEYLAARGLTPTGPARRRSGRDSAAAR
jgi:hypothetical protein